MELSLVKLLGFGVPEKSSASSWLPYSRCGSNISVVPTLTMCKTKPRANAGHPRGASIPLPERGGRSRSLWLKLRVIHWLFNFVPVALCRMMAITSTVTMLSSEVGESIPPDTAHVTINFPSIGTSNADAAPGRIRFLTNVESQCWV